MILDRKTLKGRTTHLMHPRQFFKEWRFIYWVEVDSSHDWKDIEAYAFDICKGRRTIKGKPVNKLRHTWSRYETWSTMITGTSIFGCYSKILAVKVNGRYGKDGI